MKKVDCKNRRRKREGEEERNLSEARNQRPGPLLEQALAPDDTDDRVARAVVVAAAVVVRFPLLLLLLLLLLPPVAAAATAAVASSLPFLSSTCTPPSFLFQDCKRLLEVDEGAFQQMVAHDELDAAVGLFFLLRYFEVEVEVEFFFFFFFEKR